MDALKKAKLWNFNTWSGMKLLCNDAKKRMERCTPGTAMHELNRTRYLRVKRDCERLDEIVANAELRPREERAFRLRYEDGKSIKNVVAIMQVTELGDNTFTVRTVQRYLESAINKIIRTAGDNNKQ